MESNFFLNNPGSLASNLRSSLEDVRNFLLHHGVSTEASKELYGKTKYIKFSKNFSILHFR